MKDIYDVIIVGGGTSGVAAAYAFSKKQYDVLIVEKQSSLGGTSIQGLVIDWIEGCRPEYLNNIFIDLQENGLLQGNIYNSWLPLRFSKIGYSNTLRIEPTTLCNKYINDVSRYADIAVDYEFIGIEDKNSNSIQSIRIKNIKTNEIKVIQSKYYIDCSSSGELCRSFGSSYYYGRDGKQFRNESIAYDRNPKIMNEPSLFFQVEKGYDDNQLLNNIETVFINEQKNIVKPNYLIVDGYFQQYQWPSGEKLVYICNPMTALGITGFDILNLDYHTAYKTARKRVLEYWKYLKLLSQEKNINAISGIAGDIKDYGICSIAPMVGVRESYRIECDSMLCQSDLANKIDFNNLQDIIAIGTHPIDMHVNIDLNYDELKKFNAELLQPYGVRLSHLFPKGINNVMVVGKSFGATQLALASARTNMFMSQIGWAAGNSIKYCLDNNLSNIRDIDVDKIRSQDYINFGYYINNIKSNLK